MAKRKRHRRTIDPKSRLARQLNATHDKRVIRDVLTTLREHERQANECIRREGYFWPMMLDRSKLSETAIRFIEREQCSCPGAADCGGKRCKGAA